MPSLTSLGLFLDIVGAVVVWRYGLPVPVDPMGRKFLRLKDVDLDEQARARRYRRTSHVGITLLVAGFALQFVASLS